MGKRVTMVFELDDEEYAEFMEGEEVQQDLHSWIFAEMCQNHGFGFLTGLSVEESDE